MRLPRLWKPSALLFVAMTVPAVAWAITDRLGIEGRQLHGATVSISLHNRSTQAVRLQRRLRVERLERGAWRLVEGAVPSLIDSCRPVTDPCLEIPAGGSYAAEPWFGTIGDAQCICTACIPVPAGTYRYVARSCDDTSTAIGAAFSVSRREQ